MKICSVCHKISGTNEDHLDCLEKKRIELDGDGLKEKLPEKLDMSKNANDLNLDIKAILDHMIRKKDEK